MPIYLHARQRTVVAFLEISRIHFNLNRPRSHAGSQRRFSGPRLRSLLIAGSLGALFGGPAFSDTAIDTVRDFELRPGQSATTLHGTVGDLTPTRPGKR